MPFRHHAPAPAASHDLEGHLVFLLPGDPEPAAWLLRATCTMLDGARVFLVSAPGPGETTTASTEGDVLLSGDGALGVPPARLAVGRLLVVGGELEVSGRPGVRAAVCVATGPHDWSAWALTRAVG